MPVHKLLVPLHKLLVPAHKLKVPAHKLKVPGLTLPFEFPNNACRPWQTFLFLYFLQLDKTLVTCIMGGSMTIDYGPPKNLLNSVKLRPKSLIGEPPLEEYSYFKTIF